MKILRVLEMMCVQKPTAVLMEPTAQLCQNEGVRFKNEPHTAGPDSIMKATHMCYTVNVQRELQNTNPQDRS